MPMDSSTAQSHHQIQVEVGGSETLESMLAGTKAQQEKKPRPAEQSLKCPRCESANTKFCYYNNYSLSQPRYFCKSCRRYWTKGGTLRNVPVGGGCRKAKRSTSSSSSSSRRNPITIPTSHPAPAVPNSIPSYAYNGFPAADLIDALRGGGFHEIPRFENLYNGNGNHILGLEMGMGMGMGMLNQEMGMMGFEEFSGTTTTSSAPVKQEMCSSNGDKWGFPWQNAVNIGGDGISLSSELDSIRNINAAWNVNGINGSSSTWHGLLNSPLM